MSEWTPGTCVIAGIGDTPFYRDSGMSELALARTAISGAIADAGMRPDDVDGFITYTLDTAAWPGFLAMNLGIREISYWGEASEGGNAMGAVVAQAVAVIRAGLARTIVCYRSLNGRSGRRLGQAWTTDREVGGGRGLEEFAMPFGLVAPTQSYAMLAQRYMYEFGLTSEQLGWIAVVCRKRANQNANAAMYGRPMTIGDHQHSRTISSPLRLLDCCLETDNAAAIVVTSRERALSHDSRPVAILGAAMASSKDSHGPVFYSPFEEGLTSTAADALAPRLYAQAGVTAADIDVGQIYDSFTIAVLAQLEAYGFCAKGEGGPFVEGGVNIDLGGRIPINTFGGQLSAGYVNGFSGLVEATRQLRGDAAAQVVGAQTCLVTGGMLTTTSGVILGKL